MIETLDQRIIVEREGAEAFKRGGVRCPYISRWECKSWWRGWEVEYCHAPDEVRSLMWDLRYQAERMAQ